MINKLTDDQIAMMPVIRDKWIKIGLSTEPTNRVRAEASVREMYRAAGLEPPHIVWCGSPLSQGLTRALLPQFVLASVGDSVRDSAKASVWASVWASAYDSGRDSVLASVRDSTYASAWESVLASVRASVWDSVRDSVWQSGRASVWDSVGESVRDSVGESVRDSAYASVWDSVWDSVGESVRVSVWASVRASVWDSVGESVRASVWDSVGASVRDSFRASVGDSGYGQHDVGGLAFYDFFHSAGLLDLDRVRGLWNQAESSGWYLPHKKICWISERHNILRRDERGRMHCDFGPACAYPDGWGIYAWHGVRVPEAVIMGKDATTVAGIMAEKNTEVRRVMRNLYGNERFMIDAGAQQVDASRKHGARLLALHLPGDPVEIRMVELTCPSTGNKYMERVPPDVRSVMEALSWRFRIEPAAYNPLQET